METRLPPVVDLRNLASSLRERARGGFLDPMSVAAHADRIDAVAAQLGRLLENAGPLPSYRRYPAQPPTALSLVADLCELSALQLCAANTVRARMARDAAIYLQVHVEGRDRSLAGATFRLAPAGVEQALKRAAGLMQTDRDFEALVRSAGRLLQDAADRDGDGDGDNVVRPDFGRSG